MMELNEIVGVIIRGEQALKFPLTAHNGWISDANHNHILDVRGWEYLQYHDDGHDAAAALQDAIGDWVVRTLNEEAKRQQLITI
jgi:hypothetical protein